MAVSSGLGGKGSWTRELTTLSELLLQVGNGDQRAARLLSLVQVADSTDLAPWEPDQTQTVVLRVRPIFLNFVPAR